MARYREKVISGSEWVQLGRAKIFFFADKPTRMFFEEERVKDVDGAVESFNRREILVTLDAPDTTFAIVSPNDQQPTGGDMTYRQLERAIYSLYYAKAQELDALETPQG